MGLLLNLFAVEILPDVGLFFGGVFYLAAALVYGGPAGALAALIASAPLASHFGWPAVPMVAAEAFLVGTLARKRVQAPAAELIYWATAGAPALFLAYAVVLRYPSPLRWVLIITPPLNCLVNAIGAEILFACSAACRPRWMARARSNPRPLRDHLSQRFVVIATLPLLLVSILSGRLYVTRQYRDACDYAREAALGIRGEIDAVVVRHQSGVRALAETLSASQIESGPALDRRLKQTRTVYADFDSLFVADRSGSVLGASPSAPSSPCATAPCAASAGSQLGRGSVIASTFAGRSRRGRQ